MAPKSFQNAPQNGPNMDPSEGPLLRRHFGLPAAVLKEKCAIRGQGRKALAYDASNKFVHITMKRDAFCLIPSQNKRETYQCMHLLKLICCKVVLLTP